MRFLHTSDWHLGQNLLYNDREEEHQLALDWLAKTISEFDVDVLLVAGDVFDIGNPPNYARRMYYRFLTGLLASPCRQVVITGGNHDSPSMLEAPRELLQALNMHVIGAAPEEQKDVLVELQDDNGDLLAVVAAVPFLRDRDLRYGVAGETGQERIARIREGLAKYYRNLGELALKYDGAKVPRLAMGHLFAKGAYASAKQDNIYIGDTENIDAAAFPEVFDYVALGHLHRAQTVGERETVRYSGSILPLSFSEKKDDKGIYLIDFEGPVLKETTFIQAPVFRRLKTIEGDLEKVKQSLRRFNDKGNRLLRPWVEVIVHTEEMIPQLDVELKEFTAAMDLELLKIRIDRSAYQALDDQAVPHENLKDMDELEVFRKKCHSYGCPPEEMEELEATFLELREWMNESKEEEL